MLIAWLVAGCSSPSVAVEQPLMKLAHVSGQSMLPGISDGEYVVYIDGYPWSRLTAGRVVAYRSRMGFVILHRLVSHRGDGWVSKGDNNRFYDSEWVTPANYIGVAITGTQEWEEAVELLSHGIVKR